MTIVVMGYASLDRAMSTGPFRGTGATTRIAERLSQPWPSAGGVAYLANAVATAGAETEVVSWVGPDDDGKAYADLLGSKGVGTGGIAVSGTRSPACYLFTPAGSGTITLFDPGDCYETPLTGYQAALIRQADWLLLAASPKQATEAALEAIGQAQLAWAVKADPAAFPPDLVRRLLDSASVVACNVDERSFLEEGAPPRPSTLLVETRGPAGSTYTIDGESRTIAAEPVSDVDTTGAGDTVAGTLVAALSTGKPTATAVRAATEAATAMLRARARERK